MYEGYIKVDIYALKSHERERPAFEQVLDKDYKQVRLVFHEEGSNYTEFLLKNDTEEIFWKKLSKEEFDEL